MATFMMGMMGGRGGGGGRAGRGRAAGIGVAGGDLDADGMPESYTPVMDNGSDDIVAVCEKATKNDPTLRTVQAWRFPPGCGLLLGEALQHNTHVVAMTVDVDNLLGFWDETTINATLVIKFIKNAPQLRTVRICKTTSGHETSHHHVPLVKEIAKQCVLAVARNPHITNASFSFIDNLYMPLDELIVLLKQHTSSLHTLKLHNANFAPVAIEGAHILNAANTTSLKTVDRLHKAVVNNSNLERIDMRWTQTSRMAEGLLVPFGQHVALKELYIDCDSTNDSVTDRQMMNLVTLLSTTVSLEILSLIFSFETKASMDYLVQGLHANKGTLHTLLLRSGVICADAAAALLAYFHTPLSATSNANTNNNAKKRHSLRKFGLADDPYVFDLDFGVYCLNLLSRQVDPSKAVTSAWDEVDTDTTTTTTAVTTTTTATMPALEDIPQDELVEANVAAAIGATETTAATAAAATVTADSSSLTGVNQVAADMAGLALTDTAVAVEDAGTIAAAAAAAAAETVEPMEDATTTALATATTNNANMIDTIGSSLRIVELFGISPRISFFDQWTLRASTLRLYCLNLSHFHASSCHLLHEVLPKVLYLRKLVFKPDWNYPQPYDLVKAIKLNGSLHKVTVHFGQSTSNGTVLHRHVLNVDKLQRLVAAYTQRNQYLQKHFTQQQQQQPRVAANQGCACDVDAVVNEAVATESTVATVGADETEKASSVSAATDETEKASSVPVAATDETEQALSAIELTEGSSKAAAKETEATSAKKTKKKGKKKKTTPTGNGGTRLGDFPTMFLSAQQAPNMAPNTVLAGLVGLGESTTSPLVL